MGDYVVWDSTQSKWSKSSWNKDQWNQHSHNLRKSVDKFSKVKVEEDNFYMKKAAEEIEAALALYNDRKGVEAYKRAKAVHTDLVNETMRKIADGEKKVRQLFTAQTPKPSRKWPIMLGTLAVALSACGAGSVLYYLWG